MQTTPFPARPCDVVALTVAEFASDLDPNAAVSIDDVCRRFIDDTNKALVWVIRFRALAAWWLREDVAAWLGSRPGRAQHACEVAAAFELNGDWEFDTDAFRSAVETEVSRRARLGGR
jgi:hypothetical protein